MNVDVHIQETYSSHKFTLRASAIPNKTPTKYSVERHKWFPKFIQNSKRSKNSYSISEKENRGLEEGLELLGVRSCRRYDLKKVELSEETDQMEWKSNARLCGSLTQDSDLLHISGEMVLRVEK